jgi:hypothetical protein
MRGLVPRIHGFNPSASHGVDARDKRDKRGHDDSG